MLRVRWLMLLGGIILITLAFSKEDAKDAGIAFFLSMVIGFAIDYCGIKIFRLWDYSRNPFLSLNFFTIVLPSWGVFGMTINLIWNWVETPWWIAFLILVLGQITAYEITNLATRSWSYYAPAWLVFAGWFPLVLTFRALFLLSSIII